VSSSSADLRLPTYRGGPIGRSFLATISTITVFCTHLAAAPATQPGGKGPLTAAISRNIDQLVASHPDPDTHSASDQSKAPPSDWGRVTRLRSGIECDLRTTRGIYGSRVFVLADDGQLTVLNLTHPALPASARKQLRELASDRPATLLSARQNTLVEHRGVTIGSAGVFVSGQKAAALEDVLQTIPRGEVQDVRLTRIHGSKLGAIGGAAAGVVAGFYLAPYFAMKPCGGSCGDERFLFAASLVGLPVGGALLGYAPRKQDVTVYQSAATTDDE
jgi:hypothetical protein